MGMRVNYRIARVLDAPAHAQADLLSFHRTDSNHKSYFSGIAPTNAAAADLGRA
jgi:hypothetical protein